MTPKIKSPKAGPFYKAAFLFGRTPTMETWNFLAGFCILSFISGCWLYAFPAKDDFIVAIPFFVVTVVSLFPLYIYGTKTALNEEKTQNYFAYFAQKDFWYVGIVQALLMLAFGLLFSCLEMIFGLFTDADIFKGGEKGLQLFMGAFSAFIVTHVASGRSLSVSKVLSASALAFAPSLGLYALFFMLPIFIVAIVEVFFIMHENMNMIFSAFCHAVLMGILGYIALCGSVGFGKLYQTTTEDNK